jgi:hypothetical protein
MDETVHQQAIHITQDYLGPAAERFINRQIVFHLHKNPELLTLEDLPLLAEWVKVSIAILTEDHEMVDDFSRRILLLAQ